MKVKFKLMSYGLASLVLIIIVYYFLSSFFEVLNSGMEVRIPHLGMLFQSYKIFYIFVNIAGIILCMYLLIKNSRKFFKAVLVLVSFDLFYSFSSFVWVAITYKLIEKPQEQLFGYALDVLLGRQVGIWDGVGMIAPIHFIRFLYLINFYNTFIMAAFAVIILYLKRTVDKKLMEI